MVTDKTSPIVVTISQRGRLMSQMCFKQPKLLSTKSDHQKIISKELARMSGKQIKHKISKVILHFSLQRTMRLAITMRSQELRSASNYKKNAKATCSHAKCAQHHTIKKIQAMCSPDKRRSSSRYNNQLKHQPNGSQNAHKKISKIDIQPDQQQGILI